MTVIQPDLTFLSINKGGTNAATFFPLGCSGLGLRQQSKSTGRIFFRVGRNVENWIFMGKLIFTKVFSVSSFYLGCDKHLCPLSSSRSEDRYFQS